MAVLQALSTRSNQPQYLITAECTAFYLAYILHPLPLSSTVQEVLVQASHTTKLAPSELPHSSQLPECLILGNTSVITFCARPLW
jgi:hypothetical protein